MCTVSDVFPHSGANTTTGNGFWMPSQWQYSEESHSTGGKGNIAGGLISAFIIVCLRVESWTEKHSSAGYPADHRFKLLIGAKLHLPNIIKRNSEKSKNSKIKNS